MPHELSGISEKIPKRAQRSFSLLSGEVIWLREKWINYDYLYGHSPDRIALLNQAGGAFFYMVDHLFIDDFILTLSRLTDSANGTEGNLSLEHLLLAIDPEADADLLAKLQPRLKSLRATVASIRKHRNKRVAHADYRVAISPSDVLPPVSRKLIEGALIEAEAFLGEFDFHFSGVEMLHDMLGIYNGAEVLHARLLKARAYDALEKEGSVPKGVWRRRKE